MDTSKTFRLAASLLSPDFSKNQEVIKQLEGKIDWSQLVQVASTHLVFPTLFLRFSSPEIRHKIPDDLYDYVHDIYQLNLARNQRLIVQALEVNKVLLSEGITPVFLKGMAYLFDNVYTDLGERMVGDIDLLVQEEDFLRSVVLIKDMGYSEISEFRHEELPRLKHYPRLVNPNRLAAVEVHRQPVGPKFNHILNGQLIFSSKKQAGLEPSVFVPDNKHKIAHNFLHSISTTNPLYFGTVFLRDHYEYIKLQNRMKDFQSVIPQSVNYQFEIYNDISAYLISGITPKKFRSKIAVSRLKFNLAHCVWMKYNLIFLYLLKIVCDFGKIVLKTKSRKLEDGKLTSFIWYKFHLKLIYRNIKMIYAG